MPSPSEQRATLRRIVGDATADVVQLFRNTRGTPEQRRAVLLDGTPEIAAYYADGSAALAADFYEDERDLARPTTAFTAALATDDRVVPIRRSVAWATLPLFATEPDESAVLSRLEQTMHREAFKPYRLTLLQNMQADDYCVGWSRYARPNGCAFCKLLAGRGSVYRKSETAEFAAHDSCSCTVRPHFRGQPPGEEASVIQYMGNDRKHRTPDYHERVRAAMGEDDRDSRAPRS